MNTTKLLLASSALCAVATLASAQDAPDLPDCENWPTP